jgi:chromate transporter
MAAHRNPGTLPPMLAGTLGGLLATWCTFVPCFLWIGLGAPFIERLRGNKPLNGALSAITAAVVGVILNLAVWFALHVIFAEQQMLRWGPLHFEVPVLASVNLWALLLTIGAIVAVFRLKIGMIPVLAGCALIGVALHFAGLV